MHNYESTYKQFPGALYLVLAGGPLSGIGQGLYNRPPPTQEDGNIHLWTEMLLAFLDQGNLYNSINFSVPMGFGSATGGSVAVMNDSPGTPYPASQNFAAISSSVIPSFICPSTPRNGSSLPPYLNDWWASSVSGAPLYNVGGACDYVAVAMFSAMKNAGPNSGRTIMDADSQNGSGSMGRRISSVTDGLSNTLLLGESADHANEWAMGINRGPNNESGIPGAYQGAWNDWTTGIHGMRPIQPGNYSKNNGGPGRSNGQCAVNCDNKWNLYSFHQGGVHIVLGDGSVRFITQNIDLSTLSNVICIDDGRALGEF
jgi:hypothetical protein